MSVANDILGAVKTIVEAAFSGTQCLTRRASEKNPALAPAAADASFPFFLASVNDDRPTEMLYAKTKLVKYTVTLEYLTLELPGNRDASAAIESVIDQAAKLFQVSRDNSGKPGLAGVPEVSTCNVRPLAPYSLPYGMQTANSSRMQLVFETVETA